MGIVPATYGRKGSGPTQTERDIVFVRYTAANLADNTDVNKVIALNAQTYVRGESVTGLTLNTTTGVITATREGLYDFEIDMDIIASMSTTTARAVIHLEYQKNSEKWQHICSSGYARQGRPPLSPSLHGREFIILKKGGTLRFRISRVGQSFNLTYQNIVAKVVERSLKIAA